MTGPENRFGRKVYRCEEDVILAKFVGSSSPSLTSPVSYLPGTRTEQVSKVSNDEWQDVAPLLS